MGTIEGQRECDVVMKGGITSGVVYPAALVELSKTYRFRGLGGASAGAIGAAAGAAAEFARDSGGFSRLERLPADLGGGRLGRLFQPQRETRALMRLVNAYLGSAEPGEAVSRGRGAAAVLLESVRVFPLASLLGVAPGAACTVVGVAAGGLAGWLLAVAGLVLAVLGWSLAIGFRLYRKVTVALPANLFGICRGTSVDGEHGFTDWLAESIDDVAGLGTTERPLLFGDLWSGAAVRPAFRDDGDERVVRAGGPEPARARRAAASTCA